MTIRMDQITEAMVVFFVYLSRRVNSRFVKLNEKKMTCVILKQMREYGFVELTRGDSSPPTWTATRKLLHEIMEIPKDRIDHHPGYLQLIDKGARQLCKKYGSVCLSDKWHFFELQFRVIFELQHKHCMRWLRSDAMLLEDKECFQRRGLFVAKAALFAAALNICVADMNSRSYQHEEEIYEEDGDEDDDDDDCLPPASDPSAGTASKTLNNSIVKDNVIAFPVKHVPPS
jgi:hypothetical protein